VPIVGRFVNIAKAKRKARVSRVISRPTPKRIEAMNRAVERAVQADLFSGMMTFRRDLMKIEIDRAFRDRNFTKLVDGLPWKHVDDGIKASAVKLSTLAPRTKEQVLLGITRGTTGNAARDPHLTQPINFGDGHTVMAQRGNPMQRQMELRVDAKNPNIENHMLSRKVRYLQDLVGPKHEQAFAVLESARRDGSNAQQVAGRLRDVIGLNPQQQKAVENARNKLVQDGDFSDDAINDKMEKLSQRYLKDRCRTIAITETRAASGLAQLEAWFAMEEQGVIPEGCRKQWVIGAEDACPKICEPIDGQIRALRDDFTLGNGKPCRMAGLAHPRCRCSAILLYPEDDDTARNEAAFPTKDEIKEINEQDVGGE
jgi:hypothetical protein